jgi:hypothetical protein
MMVSNQYSFDIDTGGWLIECSNLVFFSHIVALVSFKPEGLICKRKKGDKTRQPDINGNN